MFFYLQRWFPPTIILFPLGICHYISHKRLNLFEPSHHHLVTVIYVLWQNPLLILLCSIPQLLPIVAMHSSAYRQRSEGNALTLCYLVDWSLMSLLPTIIFFHNRPTYNVHIIIDFSRSQTPEALRKVQIIQNIRVCHRWVVLALK